MIMHRLRHAHELAGEAGDGAEAYRRQAMAAEAPEAELDGLSAWYHATSPWGWVRRRNRLAATRAVLSWLDTLDEATTVIWVPIVAGTGLSLGRSIMALVEAGMSTKPLFRHGSAFWSSLRFQLRPADDEEDDDDDDDPLIIVFDGDDEAAGERPSEMLRAAPLDGSVRLLFLAREPAPRSDVTTIDGAMPAGEGASPTLPPLELVDGEALALRRAPSPETLAALLEADRLEARLGGVCGAHAVLSDLSEAREAAYQGLREDGEAEVWVAAIVRSLLLEASLRDRLGTVQAWRAPAMAWADAEAAEQLASFSWASKAEAPAGPTGPEEAAKAWAELSALGVTSQPHWRLSGIWRRAGSVVPDDDEASRETAARLFEAQSTETRAWLAIEAPAATVTLLGDRAALAGIADGAQDTVLLVRALACLLPHLEAETQLEAAGLAVAKGSPAADPLGAMVAFMPWLERAAQVDVLRAQLELDAVPRLADLLGAPASLLNLSGMTALWAPLLERDPKPLVESELARLVRELRKAPD